MKDESLPKSQIAPVVKLSVQKPKTKQKSAGVMDKIASIFSFGGPKKEMQQESSDEELNEEAYLNRNISCEEVDDDDLEGGMNYSDDEDNARSRV